MKKGVLSISEEHFDTILKIFLGEVFSFITLHHTESV